MTNDEAVALCVKHKLNVNFDGRVEVSKFGSEWMGPDDIGGWTDACLVMLARDSVFSVAVNEAMLALKCVKLRGYEYKS